MIQIKVEVDFSSYKKGQIINVPVDVNGVPLSLFWRRRLKDSKIDGCIKIIEQPKKEKSQRKDK